MTIGRLAGGLRPASQLIVKILAALLNFDGGAGFGKFLLDVLGFVFGNALFDRLRGAFNKILSFLETQTGNFADDFDDADLVPSNSRENDIELSLLFSRSRSAATAGSGGRGNGNRGRSSAHAEGFFEPFDKLGGLKQRQALDRLDDALNFFRH